MNQKSTKTAPQKSPNSQSPVETPASPPRHPPRDENEYPESGRLREEEDFFIDESLVRLVSILMPRMRSIILVSCLAAAVVGAYLLFSPRLYVCTAVIAPDVMRDLTSIDLVQLKSADTETLSLPFASQLSQIKTLAESSQVKRGIINKNNLLTRWECVDERDCLPIIRP